MEAWQKVYVGGTYGKQFLESAHGKMKCVVCHGGIEPAADKTAAHAGGFIASPSRQAEAICGTCHAAIASKDASSLHTQGFGQKAMVSLRSGLAGYEQFPEKLKKGYDKNCGKCHASCGECHVQRPDQAGGGFLAGHLFQKTPDMRLNCTACHSARVAHAYFGEAFGTRPDVHYTKIPGGSCLNCHSAGEMHGEGVARDQRYRVANGPACETCHAAASAANAFHSKHWNDLACQVCHSQTYQNCSSCHVDDGVRNGPYMGFKIARNAMPGVKRFKYVVVRNAPYAPDTWSNYGLTAAPNFDAAPTFKLASPHNIQRWTERTQVENGKECYDACHITGGRNTQWFLFQSDLKSWEVQANQPVIVDGHLPPGWN
jgi:thiosulfate/3-mercaptopyruvate sulfurtransferase